MIQKKDVPIFVGMGDTSLETASALFRDLASSGSTVVRDWSTTDEILRESGRKKE